MLTFCNRNCCFLAWFRNGECGAKDVNKKTYLCKLQVGRKFAAN